MTKFEQIFVWLIWRAWPLWGIAGVITFHLLIIFTMPVDVVLTNKIASAFMQIVGGLIIIFSVDSNLGLFRKQSLPGAILAWVRECPLCSKDGFAVGSICATTGSATASGYATVSCQPTTVEERITELERVTAQIRADVESKYQATISHIVDTKKELNNSIAANQQAVNELSQKVETATVGGFKQQAFGVMLAVWGAGTSVFA